MTDPLSLEERKRLTLFIGECWHETVSIPNREHKRCSCGAILGYPCPNNRTFLTGNDMVALVGAVLSKGYFVDILASAPDRIYCAIGKEPETIIGTDAKSVNELPPRFAKLVAEWLEQKGE